MIKVIFVISVVLVTFSLSKEEKDPKNCFEYDTDYEG